MEKEQFIEWFHEAFEPYATSIMGEFLKIDGKFIKVDERLANLEDGQRLLRAEVQQLSRRLERVEVEVLILRRDVDEIKADVAELKREMAEVKALLHKQDERIEISAGDLFALRVRVERLEAAVFA